MGGDPGAQPSLKYSSEGRNRGKTNERIKNHLPALLNDTFSRSTCISGHRKRGCEEERASADGKLCASKFSPGKLVLAQLRQGAISAQKEECFFDSNHSQLAQRRPKPPYSPAEPRWAAMPELWGKSRQEDGEADRKTY